MSYNGSTLIELIRCAGETKLYIVPTAIIIQS